jgi:hypothetical protein
MVMLRNSVTIDLPAIRDKSSTQEDFTVLIFALSEGLGE